MDAESTPQGSPRVEAPQLPIPSPSPEQIEALKEHARGLDRRVRATVAEHPIASIAAAAVTGYLLGRLVKQAFR